MSAFDLKLLAATNAKHWQLALDKFPFNLERREAPSLSKLDDKGKEHSIKPARLLEIRDRYNAAKPELQKAVEQRQRFLASLALQHGTRFRRIPLVNASRLLLHLGRSSVLENVGLYCERTTGLPVIPGPAVKGVVSTWACWEGNALMDEFTRKRSRLGSDLVEILGANPAEDAGARDAAGKVIFLGGFPQSVPVMELDIVTPHPQEGRGKITPSPFLAIKAETKWDFVLLAPSRNTDAGILLAKAATWLTESLTQAGIGAKTATGYGNFRELTEAEPLQDTERFMGWIKRLESERAEVTMSPEERTYHDFVKAVTDWAPLARDILSKTEPDKSHILRYFRSSEGQALMKAWPKNEKAKIRLTALKDAGL